MKIIGIIPARYKSERFPGKPLADIRGKTMIQRVYEQAMKARLLDEVIVATDDPRIFGHVKGFGGKVVMTSADHFSGTERCEEALKLAGKEKFDGIINIQGDEPFIDPGQIETVASMLEELDIPIATLAKQISDPDEITDPNVVKVVFDHSMMALYFSRSPIPYLRTVTGEDWLAARSHYKHIGLYGYRPGVLEKITRLSPTPLEKAESLEQLRWMEHGFGIKVGLTGKDSKGIDTPDDLSKITNIT